MNDQVFMLHDPERCANQSSEKGGPKCSNKAQKGHIYCYGCYLANRGYDRYNRPAIIN